MYCTNCGQKINPSDKFCSSCGREADVSMSEQVSSSRHGISHATTEARSTKSFWKRFIGELPKNEADAKYYFHEGGKMFYVLAVIGVLFAIFAEQPTYFVDVVLLLVIGVSLQKKPGKTTAVVALLYAIITTIVTILNLSGNTNLGGRNIILAIFVLLTSVRVYQSAKYTKNGLASTEQIFTSFPETKHQPQQNKKEVLSEVEKIQLKLSNRKLINTVVIIGTGVVILVFAIFISN